MTLLYCGMQCKIWIPGTFRNGAPFLCILFDTGGVGWEWASDVIHSTLTHLRISLHIWEGTSQIFHLPGTEITKDFTYCFICFLPSISFLPVQRSCWNNDCKGFKTRQRDMMHCAWCIMHYMETGVEILLLVRFTGQPRDIGSSRFFFKNHVTL